MLKTLTKKLRRQSLNEMHPFQLKISYHGSEEGWESEDSEGENQELAQIDRERRRNCGLTPLATSQQHNQGALSPAQLRRLRLLLDPTLDRHSSEEELERISRDFLQGGAGEGVRWALHPCHAELSSTSSDEEVKDLCGPMEPSSCVTASPSPVLFSASPPRNLRPLSRGQARPIILTHFEQPAGPYRRHRPGYGGESGRPSLDLEKMQQKMLLKKNCGGKARTIKIRGGTRAAHRHSAALVKAEAFSDGQVEPVDFQLVHVQVEGLSDFTLDSGNLTGSRPPPRFAYDPSVFAFRSLSTIPPRSPLTPPEEPPCT
ncbi:uncharacterized protein si:dkey-16j16.4 isoform X1 [Brienomyrus brachyistius]|uniref:uncharacterized protein si:dkey-16j16.4 isoform X1 n=1 Tax=Brienomyrus brachyistius TaxID=42636 RepID=UPI0020B2CD91|nr:uncharacterized protein si:dkey-16j16.4 isoform X1 [Brienomyrus brachyistius]